MEKKSYYKREEFFELENKVDEDILHCYHSCDKCGCEPIWGVRFECKVCEGVDFCECNFYFYYLILSLLFLF